MKPVIRVENLSKSYRLGQITGGTLSEDLNRWWARLRGQPDPYLKIGQMDHGNRHGEYVWALDDVSFEVYQGEVLGIIGRNGAGKSTLLKILSRVTAPTSGRVRIKGRIASLLEVGTGFHPDLTGRENIYLNGAILGMKKSEITRKFDEIVGFAEVEQFIDTPVKRYSSGMYVRLAFAVAAHLEPEILIVDEVLAVGDAAFQKKCLGKMGDVANKGRTVLFVSHNMAAIRQLCRVGLLLSNGELFLSGNISDVLTKYLSVAKHKQQVDSVSKYGVRLSDCSIVQVNNRRRTNLLDFNESYYLDIEIEAEKKIDNVNVVVKIYDTLGALISSICTPEEGLDSFSLENKTQIKFYLPRIQLLPGKYVLGVFAYEHHGAISYLEENTYSFEVQPAIVRDAMWSYLNIHGVVRIADGAVVTSTSKENAS